MAKILEGKQVVAALGEEMRGDVRHLAEMGLVPALAVIRVGERGDDIAYERGVIKRCESVGVTVKQYTLPADATQQQLLEVIGEVNTDSRIHGALLFRPLPEQFDDNAVRGALLPAKDVDGITDLSMAGVFTLSGEGFAPCTAQACMEILDHFGYGLQGKRVVVVGRSLVVGKPVAMMLLARHATVTLCHTRTVDMPGVCREAEILIVAAGKAGVVDAGYLAPGQVVIDVGINFGPDGKMCGDVDFAQAVDVVEAITPVPGGVGTVTTSVLVRNVVAAAKRCAGVR